MIASVRRNPTERVAAGAFVGLLLGGAVAWIAVDVLSPAAAPRPMQRHVYMQPAPGNPNPANPNNPYGHRRFRFGQGLPNQPNQPNQPNFPGLPGRQAGPPLGS